MVSVKFSLTIAVQQTWEIVNLSFNSNTINISTNINIRNLIDTSVWNQYEFYLYALMSILVHSFRLISTHAQVLSRFIICLALPPNWMKVVFIADLFSGMHDLAQDLCHWYSKITNTTGNIPAEESGAVHSWLRPFPASLVLRPRTDGMGSGQNISHRKHL